MNLHAVPVFLRYVLIQTPGWTLAGLAAWAAWDRWGVSAELSGGLLGLWVAKDFALYPFLRAAYALRPSSMIGPEHLVGSPGVADGPLDPNGYVRVRGERWRAESPVRVEAGAAVVVRALRGLTLQVEPEDAAGAPPSRPG